MDSKIHSDPVKCSDKSLLKAVSQAFSPLSLDLFLFPPFFVLYDQRAQPFISLTRNISVHINNANVYMCGSEHYFFLNLRNKHEMYLFNLSL